MLVHLNYKKQSSNTLGFAINDNANEEVNDNAKKLVMEEVKKQFKPEFLNRIDVIIIFQSTYRQGIITNC